MCTVVVNNKTTKRYSPQPQSINQSINQSSNQGRKEGRKEREQPSLAKQGSQPLARSLACSQSTHWMNEGGWWVVGVVKVYQEGRPPTTSHPPYSLPTHSACSLFCLCCRGVVVVVSWWWCCGVVVLWCCGVVVLWWCGGVVVWCCGLVVSWCCGVVVLWCCLLLLAPACATTRLHDYTTPSMPNRQKDGLAVIPCW